MMCDTENLVEWVLLLEVLEDLFVLISLYHRHPKQIYSQMTAASEMIFEIGQQEEQTDTF